MSDQVTERVLANWQELYEELRKATPSSPVWYSIIDMCVGVLMSTKIDELEAALKTAERGITRSGRTGTWPGVDT